MIEAKFVPIQDWPRKKTPSYMRKSSPFRSTWMDTLSKLEYELEKLKELKKY